MTDCGTIGSIEENSSPYFVWNIPQFRSLKANVGHFYWSPDMHHLDNIWNLIIYPKGTIAFPGGILLQLWRTKLSAETRVRFSVGIHRTEYRVQDEFLHSERFSKNTCVSSDLFQLMGCCWLSNPFNNYNICSDILRLYLSLSIDDRPVPRVRTLDSAESETEKLTAISTGQKDCPPKGDDAILRKHLEDMLLAGDSHDVTIKVKHQQFKAHKCMLQARSPVFSAMFKHNMKESTDDSISIDDCDPESFGELLHYIYTAKVKNLSLSNAMGLYYAGDKYDFSGLKKTCLDFLKTSLSTTVISDVITLAIKHSEDELLECAMAFVAKHLEEIMSSVEWQRFLLDNPIQANEICLKAVKLRSHGK